MKSQTDASGAIVEQTKYDSFGNATANLSTRYQFTGREFDNLTGLHYYRARRYDASVGRFIWEDPNGLAVGINHHGCVGGKVLDSVNPKNVTCNQ
jgi:RHS repeat-associated protein